MRLPMNTTALRTGRPLAGTLLVMATLLIATFVLPWAAAESPAQSGQVPPPGREQAQTADDKIDPQVRQSLEQNGRAPVVLLCQTQLLHGPAAFEEFCRTHADAKRRALRTEVVEQLKDIAEAEQPGVLEALNNPAGARRLWLVNAISARLSAEQIQQAAGLDAVKYIYPAGRLPNAATTGEVSVVLTAGESSKFNSDGKDIAWNLKEVGIDRVWNELNVTGSGVTVVSFDSGVNYAHEDLRDHIWINEDEIPNNGKDDDQNGWVDDLYGYNFAQGSPEVRVTGERQHGTWTTGIMAGDGTGGAVTGAAPDATIMIIRAGGGPAMAITAYQYMIENGADVVNMSFSNPNLGNTRGLWRLMAEQAVCAGLVQASGAGNFQQQAEIPVQLRVPEDIPCVIAAGGIDRRREVVPFSSLGPVEWGTVKFYEDHPMPDGLLKPDICGFPGPGIPLLGTENAGYLDADNGRRGNSFSGPLAAGTSALILSANPDLPAWKVKHILESTATDIEPAGKDNRTGAGLINAFEAVKAASSR